MNESRLLEALTPNELEAFDGVLRKLLDVLSGAGARDGEDAAGER